MTAGAAGRDVERARRPLDRIVEHPLRQLFAGAAFALAFANAALIAYLDLLVSDYGTYVWVIQGPEPFGSFGSDPFQLWLHVGFVLAVGGLAAVGAALLLGRRFLLVVGAAASAIGLVGGPGTLLGALG